MRTTRIHTQTPVVPSSGSSPSFCTMGRKMGVKIRIAAVALPAQKTASPRPHRRYLQPIVFSCRTFLLSESPVSAAQSYLPPFGAGAPHRITSSILPVSSNEPNPTPPERNVLSTVRMMGLSMSS